MELYEHLKASFEVCANERQAQQMAAYMRHQFAFYGLQSPGRRAQYSAFLKAEKRISDIDDALLDRCWNDEYREFQYFVIDYLSAKLHFLTFEDIPRFTLFIQTKQWWDSIDNLAPMIGKVIGHDVRGEELMLRWSVDDDFWIRRIAIIHQLTRKSETNTALLAQILINNFGSNEFFINKAIGWSLRNYSKTNPQWVRQFIAENQERMHKLSIREGSKYI